MTWDPMTYAAFTAPRLRPALDLLGRVVKDGPSHVADLGCGIGNVTRLLAERWHEAQVVGVDTSPEMLAEAGGRVRYVQADAATWEPDAPLDVLFSNAALHWIDDHGILFPRLMGLLAPGGILAVQMPRNHGAPSHTCMVETARSGPWASILEPVLRVAPVEPPGFYYNVLEPLSVSLDIWETEYLQVLEGENPVVKWTMGTALRPILAQLEGEWREQFLAEYGARIREAYPPQPDGTTVFPFRRVFVVARAPG